MLKDAFPPPEALRAKALEAHRRLLAHFGKPLWRQPLPPLDELVSTILSQNTNDANRDRAFFALKARYPSWEAVRDAPAEEVIDTIRPAGLANQKGPRIQNVLRQITAEQGRLTLDYLAEMPPEEAKRHLTRFKGVGPKTAAIVLQFSLGKPAFPVDTHIYRVTGRLGLRPPNLNREQAHDFLEKWGLVNEWSYLVGTKGQLEPIWKAYFVDPAVDDKNQLQTSNPPSPPAQTTGALDALSQQITNAYLVIHSSPVFLIDREGQRRVVFTSPLDPLEIAHDIRLLLDD